MCEIKCNPRDNELAKLRKTGLTKKLYLLSVLFLELGKLPFLLPRPARQCIFLPK